MIRLQKLLLLLIVLLTADVLAASAQDASDRKRQRERQRRYDQLKRKQYQTNARKNNRSNHRSHHRTNSRSTNRGGSSSRTSSRKSESKPPWGYSVPKKGIRYVFLLEMQRQQKNEIFGGVASFRRIILPDGKTSLEVKDNIIPRSTTNWKKWATPPTGRAFLPSSIKFSSNGKHPSVDGKMHLMMGNPADWFFPPLPKNPGDSLSKSYKVKKMTIYGTSFKGKHNSGNFKWSVKSSGNSFRDQRFFKTDDDGIQLKGSGSFAFNQRLGMMTRRTFQANINQYDIKYHITLRIMKL